MGRRRVKLGGRPDDRRWEDSAFVYITKHDIFMFLLGSVSLGIARNRSQSGLI